MKRLVTRMAEPEHLRKCQVPRAISESCQETMHVVDSRLLTRRIGGPSKVQDLDETNLYFPCGEGWSQPDLGAVWGNVSVRMPRPAHDQYIKFIPLWRTVRCFPDPLNLTQRGFVVCFGSDWFNIHDYRLKSSRGLFYHILGAYLQMECNQYGIDN